MHWPVVVCNSAVWAKLEWDWQMSYGVYLGIFWVRIGEGSEAFITSKIHDVNLFLGVQHASQPLGITKRATGELTRPLGLGRRADCHYAFSVVSIIKNKTSQTRSIQRVFKSSALSPAAANTEGEE